MDDSQSTEFDISTNSSNPKTLPTRRNYQAIEARDPHDLGVWDLRISDDKLQWFSKAFGPPDRDVISWKLQEFVHCARPTLLAPRAIFKDVRSDVADRDWLCYCGVPSCAFHAQSGTRRQPWPNSVMLVYVNESREVFKFEWVEADRSEPHLPVDHETRFGERLL